MKDTDQILKKFYKRLTVEAVLRSLIIGAIIGLSVALIGVICSYVLELNIAIIAFCFGLIVCIVTTICCYLIKYKPTKIELASRIDIMGLQERVLTMTELEGSDSYIAQLQRQDAEKFITKIQGQKLKLSVNKMLAIFCIGISCICFFATGIVVASQEGYVPSFSEVVDDLYDNLSNQEYAVAYLSDGGGMVLGSVYQVVARGQNSDEVVATADDGYEFIEWSDGYVEPIRRDFDVKEDIEVYAVFSVITISDGSGGSLDDALNIPDMDMEGEVPDGMGSGGEEYSDNNQVLDGETNYKDVYDKYKEEAEDELDSSGVPSDVKDFLDSYLNTLT